ncbi:probable glutamate receptor [Panulirus ornatus]|uniref:probable glutamate receptor n=1 Tax=Panulirus ornatus TaxID=150431 RepID=UPI003A87F159
MEFFSADVSRSRHDVTYGGNDKVNPDFINLNPLSMEMLRLACKPQRWNLESSPPMDLYKFHVDVSAAENIGRILTQRCLESRICEISTAPEKYKDSSEKVRAYLSSVKEGDICPKEAFTINERLLQRWFSHQPELVVAMNPRILTKVVVKEDVKTPGGKRLWFEGDQVDILDYLAKGLNFTYTFVQPPDKGSGRKLGNGSWSGVVGMVSREEADFAVGPFSITASRSEVVDLTTPLDMSYVLFMAGRGRPEVDPWGFLLPLTPMVWAAILTALLVLLASKFLIHSYLSRTAINRVNWQMKSSDFIRILLQQEYMVWEENWWWERLVLGVWMMMTLVLTRSYAGNLVSYLAVRHIPQHYQSLRDVLDDQAASIIWQRDSSTEQYIREKDYGILKELASMQGEGRIKRKKVDELFRSIDTLVRQGDHVLTVYEDFLIILLGQHFSKTGLCDFYKLKDKIKPSMAGMIVPKDSHLLHHFNDKVLAMRESGLYDFWVYSAIPNYTACLNPSSKISVSTSLTITNSWMDQYVAHMDLEKACGRVERDDLWKVIRVYGVGDKLLELMRFYQELRHMYEQEERRVIDSQ